MSTDKMKRALSFLAVLLLFCPTALMGQNNSGSFSNNQEGAYGNNEIPDSTQNKGPEGIIYDIVEESDSMLTGKVNIFSRNIRSVKIFNVEHPVISPHGIELFDHVHGIDGQFFVDRGALGQCHYSLYPFNNETNRQLTFHNSESPLAFRLNPNPFPALRHKLHNKSLFQTRQPYTMLQYGSSLNKDYQIAIVHTQNIMPRWNIAFCYDLTSRDGVYTNSGGTNHLLDVTTNYYSPDARYQLQAAVTYNRMRQEENGGVENDTTCWDYSRREGVPVNMYNAQNQWRDLEINVHQTFNTVRQFDYLKPRNKKTGNAAATDEKSGVKNAESNKQQANEGQSDEDEEEIEYDTIPPLKPHVYNTGVFGLDMHLSRERRIFSDLNSTSWFYGLSSLDTTVYFDSTAHYRASADIYWTNDAYMSHHWHNPLVLLFGLRPELNRIEYANSHRSLFSVNPFAQLTLDKGRIKLKIRAEEVTGEDRNGDYRLDGNMEIALGKRSMFNIALLSESQTPEMLYFYNEGCFAWDNGNLDKVKRQQLAVGYHLTPDQTGKSHVTLLETHSSVTLLSDNIWLNSNMQPTQSNATGLLLQASLLSQFHFGWFNIRLQQMLQHSSDDEVIRVPLFASKNSIYADMKIFHNALHIQSGVDLRYHTKFFADGWNPVIGAWYRQDEVKIGDYLVADLWLTLQVKRASIYIKASHLNAAIEELLNHQSNYFSLPHYPMENFVLYWGVIWKFFD